MQLVKPKERSATPPEGALADVLNPDDYVNERSHVFQSMESFRYFLRKHRTLLFERGALLEIGGRILIVAPKFDQCIFDICSTPRATTSRAFE